MRKSLLFCLMILPFLFQIALAGDELPRKPWIGLQLNHTNAETRKKNNIPDGQGLLVEHVIPGGPGESSGMKAGDWILKAGEKEIAAIPDLLALLGDKKAGDTLPFQIIRDGRKQEIQFELKARPLESSKEFDIIYDSVKSGDALLRCIISKPKAEKENKKHPALLWIQGLGTNSIDSPGNPNGFTTAILYELTRKGFITMRCEKSGIGDSTGKNARDVDFDTEVKGFEDALKKLKALDGVDPEQVFIFGHSMGGVMGPIIANRVNVKGVIVYGTLGKNWAEYELENERRQAELEGTDFSEIEDMIRLRLRWQNLFYIEKKSPGEIFKQEAKLEKLIGPFMTDSHLWGRHYTFLQQLYDVKMSEVWKNFQGHALVVWGQADFVSSKSDHDLIGAIVNKAHPKHATVLHLENADHGFSKFKTEEDSYKGRMRGEFNPEITKAVLDWMNKVMVE